MVRPPRVHAPETQVRILPVVYQSRYYNKIEDSKTEKPISELSVKCPPKYDTDTKHRRSNEGSQC